MTEQEPDKNAKEVVKNPYTTAHIYINRLIKRWTRGKRYGKSLADGIAVGAVTVDQALEVASPSSGTLRKWRRRAKHIDNR